MLGGASQRGRSTVSAASMPRAGCPGHRVAWRWSVALPALAAALARSTRGPPRSPPPAGTIPAGWGKQGYVVNGTVNNTDVLQTL